MASEKTGKASWWSITINNPTDDDKQQWSSLGNLPWVKETKGQLEHPEGGTLHIQGAVRTDYGRFFQKLCEALPRAHVEPARNDMAIQKYVVKPETRVGSIAPVKTAGPGDVQSEIYSEMFYNGNRYFETWAVAQDDFVSKVEQHRDHITRHWEVLFDAAISRLIRAGYYGVEFAAANQQIRVAFKKYLPDILIRCHTRSNL